MPKDLMNKQIYDLKEMGVSTHYIARKYGISIKKVLRICVNLREKEFQPLSLSFASALSPMIGKVLINYWGDNEILDQPDIIVALGAASLSKVKRIGPKSLQMIAENLQRFGCIDDPDFWLAGH
ncbi:MAG: hypothetical protein KKA70_00555 [Proteobacteria bacterium]|nr:hypothetical protein [Pseudomonadota bacterium]